MTHHEIIEGEGDYILTINMRQKLNFRLMVDRPYLSDRLKAVKRILQRNELYAFTFNRVEAETLRNHLDAMLKVNWEEE